jgi:hypothetical protein
MHPHLQGLLDGPGDGRQWPVDTDLADALAPEGSGLLDGGDRQRFDPRVGDAIGTGSVFQGQFQDLAAEMGIGTGVVIEPALQCVQAPVGLRAQSVMQSRRMALVAGEDAFLFLKF